MYRYLIDSFETQRVRPPEKPLNESLPKIFAKVQKKKKNAKKPFTFNTLGKQEI